MKDKEGAERACADPYPIIDGRKANVNLAYLGAKPKPHNHPSMYTDSVALWFNQPCNSFSYIASPLSVFPGPMPPPPPPQRSDSPTGNGLFATAPPPQKSVH